MIVEEPEVRGYQGYDVIFSDVAGIVREDSDGWSGNTTIREVQEYRSGFRP